MFPMCATGTIFQIERFALHDGPGIRTTVFLKGCAMRCWWCHSPESQSIGPEPFPRPERCIHCGECLNACTHGALQDTADGVDTLREMCEVCGDCVVACPSGSRDLVGWKITVAELLAEVERDTAFHDRSGGGVTFSGGEPLLQPRFLGEAIGACRARGIHTAVETAGFVPWHSVEVAAAADLVLYDLKLLDEEKHRKYTGVSNRPILSNLARLLATGTNVRVRVPLVPGINDALTDLDALGRALAGLGVRDVDLLPYHTAGLAKYARLGRTPLLPETQAPDAVQVSVACDRLEIAGLSVHVGG